MKDNLIWICRKVRTTKKYIAFLVFQLLLSTSILLFAIFNSRSFRSPIALGLQYLLIFCMLLDLVIRFYSQDSFFKSKNNILDTIIFGILIAIVLIVTIVPDEEQVFEMDDLILLIVISTRYLIQIIRLGFMIKNSRETVAMTVEMKGMDFNKSEPGAQVSENTHNHSMQRSEILRDYIKRMQMEQNPQQQAHIELNQQI